MGGLPQAAVQEPDQAKVCEVLFKRGEVVGLVGKVTLIKVRRGRGRC